MSTDAEPGAIRVVVGQVGRPFGVRGQVFVTPLTDSPELRFAVGARVSLAADPAKFLTVVEQRPQSGRLVVSFENVLGRDGAAELTGSLLEAVIDPAEPTGVEDEYFDHQLVGIPAHTVDGNLIGPVVRVEHLPDQDSLIVVNEAGDEVWVPFVREIVPNVDIANSRITVDPPPGLLGEEPDE